VRDVWAGIRRTTAPRGAGGARPGRFAPGPRRLGADPAPLKNDPDGAGTKIALPHGQYALTCPVRALAAWRDAAGLADGAVFVSVTQGGRATATRLSDRDVARVVRAAVAAAGYDPAGFARHSLRAGFATSAARAGVPERAIMQHTRHRSATVLRGYVRRGGLFRDDAASKGRAVDKLAQASGSRRRAACWHA
jgi:integrase